MMILHHIPLFYTQHCFRIFLSNNLALNGSANEQDLLRLDLYLSLLSYTLLGIIMSDQSLRCLLLDGFVFSCRLRGWYVFRCVWSRLLSRVVDLMSENIQLIKMTKQCATNLGHLFSMTHTH